MNYPQETKGTRIAREVRQKANKLTKEQRAELLKRGLELIYHGNPPPQQP